MPTEHKCTVSLLHPTLIVPELSKMLVCMT